MDKQVSEKIEEFFKQFREKVYKKGEIIIPAGDEPAGIVYLKKGRVKQYSISRNGEELVINLFKPISFFPMSWAINGSINEYYYEAVTESQVVIAPRETVVSFVKANPDVLYNLMSRVYKGMDGLLMRMRYLMAGSAYTRLITELVIHAKRFGGTKFTNLELKITEIDIAAQSGMTRETVSREMKKLKDKGLVSFNKNILVIFDLDQLESELMG